MEDKNVKCPICREIHHEKFLVGFDRVFPKTENFNYVKCTKCSLVFISPMPDENKISSFYGDTYGPHQPKETEELFRFNSTHFNRFIINNYLGINSIKKEFSIKTKIAKFLSLFGLKTLLLPYGENRLLDVGCGSGSWLFHHKELGWKAEGVEMNTNACEKARNLGVNVYQGTIFDVPKHNQYDIITFNHVIEHVPNPVETINMAKDLLAPNGIIIMLLPNLNSYGFKKFGNCWFPLDPPRHLLQFSSDTIHSLAKASGMKVIHLETVHKPRFIWKSYIYKKYLGNDFFKINDLEKRKEKINLCIEKENKYSFVKKIHKKLSFFHNIFLSSNNGEVMKVVITREN